MIEQVEELSANLKVNPLFDGDDLEKRDVEVEEPRPDQHVAAEIAVGELRWKRECRS